MRIQSLHDLHYSFPDIDGYWNLQDLVRTEQKIRQLLPANEETLSPEQIEALTQLARLYSLQGKMKEARDFLTLAQALLSKLSPEDRVRPEIRYFLEEGRFYCLSMFPSRALESFKQAWLRSQETRHHVFAIDAAYMISITLPVKLGREWLLQATRIAETCQDPAGRAWLAHLFMMDGWHSFDSHNFEKALSSFEKAKTLSSESESMTTQRTLKWSAARTLRALGQFEKSLQIQEEILADLEQTGDSNGHVYLEIAECYQALQLPAKSRSYFEMAFDKLKKDPWYSDNFDEELSRMQKNAKKTY